MTRKEAFMRGRFAVRVLAILGFLFMAQVRTDEKIVKTDPDQPLFVTRDGVTYTFARGEGGVWEARAEKDGKVLWKRRLDGEKAIHAVFMTFPATIPPRKCWEVGFYDDGGQRGLSAEDGEWVTSIGWGDEKEQEKPKAVEVPADSGDRAHEMKILPREELVVTMAPEGPPPPDENNTGRVLQGEEALRAQGIQKAEKVQVPERTVSAKSSGGPLGPWVIVCAEKGKEIWRRELPRGIWVSGFGNVVPYQVCMSLRSALDVKGSRDLQIDLATGDVVSHAPASK